MIVPIFEIIESKKYIVATAFILDKLLITAAHTFHDDNGNRIANQFEFNIGNTFYPLEKSIHDEYKPKGEKYLKSDHIYEDLIIFKLPVNVEYISELTLSTNCSYNNQIRFWGYPNSDFEAVPKTGRIINCMESVTNLTSGDSNMRHFHNCFRIDTAVDEGFSGGPVFSDNEVYGMVVFGLPGCGTTAIKSEYILEKIRNPYNA